MVSMAHGTIRPQETATFGWLFYCPMEMRDWWEALGTKKRVEYRKALTEQLIEGWSSERQMGAVARQAAVIAGVEPEGEFAAHNLAKHVLKQGFIDWRKNVKTSMPTICRSANEQLWRGAKTETVRKSLLRLMGMALPKSAGLRVSERSRSKWRDWATVK